jgi:hypothetical protein
MERAGRDDQDEADDEIDHGPGQRDDELLPRIRRQSRHAGDAPDGQQRHLRRLDAIAPGGDDMTELVQHHAGEEEYDEERALDRRARAAPSPGGERNPGEEQEEGDVDLDRCAAEAADGKRPKHRLCLLVAAHPPRQRLDRIDPAMLPKGNSLLAGDFHVLP